MIHAIWAFLCVTGIIYTLILTACSFGRGVIFMWVWSIVLLICLSYGGSLWAEVDGVFKVNTGDGVPVWIFTPMILVASPTMATVLRYAIYAQKKDNERRRNLRGIQ